MSLTTDVDSVYHVRQTTSDTNSQVMVLSFICYRGWEVIELTELLELNSLPSYLIVMLGSHPVADLTSELTVGQFVTDVVIDSIKSWLVGVREVFTTEMTSAE